MDSQNTYQKDVKIKSEKSYTNIVLVIILAFVVCIGGYTIYDTNITKSYENGYATGYAEAKTVGERVGYNKGYSDGYDEGYDVAKAKYASSDSSSNSNKSTNKGNSNNTAKIYDYVLNKNTDKFHYTWCYSVDQMKEKNKVYFTGTRQEVINKGYSPCKNCNP